MDDEILKLLTVFIAGAFGAIIGPFVKTLFEKRNRKKTVKIENRPEVYNELIYFLIHNKCSENMKLDNLKAKLITYAEDDIIERVIEYIDAKNNLNQEAIDTRLHNLIGYIRGQLHMGTDFEHKDLNVLIGMKENV